MKLKNIFLDNIAIYATLQFYGKVAITVEQNFFNARKNINVDLKKRIAKKALEFVNEGGCIFFDNSTTVYHLAGLLRGSSKKNIVVASNSTFIMV